MPPYSAVDFVLCLVDSTSHQHSLHSLYPNRIHASEELCGGVSSTSLVGELCIMTMEKIGMLSINVKLTCGDNLSESLHKECICCLHSPTFSLFPSPCSSSSFRLCFGRIISLDCVVHVNSCLHNVVSLHPSNYPISARSSISPACEEYTRNHDHLDPGHGPKITRQGS